MKILKLIGFSILLGTLIAAAAVLGFSILAVLWAWKFVIMSVAIGIAVLLAIVMGCVYLWENRKK